MKAAKPPFISLIIPALNEEKYLPRLLTDLTRQTMTDFEVIVVDGHSEDATLAKAKKYTAKLARLILLECAQRNVSHQRNLGARHARAHWLLFIDADDRLPAYFLQGIRYKLEAYEPDFFSTYLKPDSTHIKDQAIATAINYYLEIQKKTVNAGGLGAMLGFKSRVFKKLNGFDSKFLWGEEGDICYRALQANYKFSLFKDPQFIYSLRRLKNQGTLQTARSLAQLELARIFRYQLNPGKVSALYPMQAEVYRQFNQAAHRNTFYKIFQDLPNLKSLPHEFLAHLKPSSRITSKLRSLYSLLNR
jgi:glycosyltransferase involved in cell wall biosynthesis